MRLLLLVALGTWFYTVVDFIRTGNSVVMFWVIMPLTFTSADIIILKGREAGAPHIRYYLPSILLLSLGMDAQMILVADREELPLSQVELRRDSASIAILGRLVARSDGYWHVLTGSQLVAVTDVDVSMATTSA